MTFNLTRIKNFIMKITGYYIMRNNYVPVGVEAITDLKHKIKLPIGVIFDVGANIGQTSLKYSKHFPSAKIFAFEPIQSTFDQLNINTKGIKNITLIKSALGPKSGKVKISLFDDTLSVLNSLNQLAMNSATHSKKEMIEVMTGDEFCQLNHISKIDLLKIDTEGYELSVLEGFKQMLTQNKIKALYCEVGFSKQNKRNTLINEIIDFANQNNFVFCGLYEIQDYAITLDNNFGNVLLLNKSYKN